MKSALNPARYAATAIVVLVVGVGGYMTFQTIDASATAPSDGYTLLDGRQSTSDRLRGKVVLTNFWAASCTTCVHEMLQIVATHDTPAVAMSYDQPAYVINFAETRELPFAVAIDNSGAIAKSLGQIQVRSSSLPRAC